MHILLTRPLEDCSEMILKFRSLGHLVSHLPLLSIEKSIMGKLIFRVMEELFLRVQTQ